MVTEGGVSTGLAMVKSSQVQDSTPKVTERKFRAVKFDYLVKRSIRGEVVSCCEVSIDNPIIKV